MSDVSQPKPEGRFAGLSPTSEAALAAFDAAFVPFAPNEALLEGAPSRALSDALTAFVTTLTHLDTDRVAKRNGWWSQLTGADLEARLELEIAAHRLNADMRALAHKAAVARHAGMTLKADVRRLRSTAPAHQRLAAETKTFLEGADPKDANVARLQRRLANLETMIVSNQVVGAQMLVALKGLANLIDRYTDIEQRLFPLWRHHALAIAQSVGRTVEPKVLDELRAVRARLAPHRQGAPA